MAEDLSFAREDYAPIIESIIDAFKEGNDDATLLADGQAKYERLEQVFDSLYQQSREQIENAQSELNKAIAHGSKLERDTKISTREMKLRMREINKAKFELNTQMNSLEIKNTSQRARIADLKRTIAELAEESRKLESDDQTMADALKLNVYKSLGVTITGTNAMFGSSHGIQALPLVGAPTVAQTDSLWESL